MKKLNFSVLAFLAFIACVGSPSFDGYKTSTLHAEDNISNNDTIINFENYEIDKLPNGFTRTATGKSQTLNWKVVNDNGNKVAAQLAKSEWQP